ncbi:MAG: hypothetical protein Q4G05_01865 [Clostridia bacterium]|nr:hypothetical protein [Clostridia bacterium]
MGNIFKIVLVIIGTIIGAGFASGKEIEIFFIDYGVIGIIGLLITSAVMSLIVYKILKIVENKKIKNYEQFLEETCNLKSSNTNMLKDIIKCIMNIFLLVTFFAMTSGFSSFFKQEFGIPMIISSIVFVILCYITLLGNINGVVKINTVLIPFLILYILFLGLKNMPNISFGATREIKQGWMFSSLLYASYNSLMLIPVLIDLKKYYEGKKNIKNIAVCLFVTFFIIMITIFSCLFGREEIGNIELPMLYVIKNFGSIYQGLYGLIIVIAIFTSAIAAEYGFLVNVTKTRKQYTKMLIIVSIFSAVFSQVSFSYFIKIMYPFFGFLGLLQIFLIFKNKCSRI